MLLFIQIWVKQDAIEIIPSFKHIKNIYCSFRSTSNSKVLNCSLQFYCLASALLDVFSANYNAFLLFTCDFSC